MIQIRLSSGLFTGAIALLSTGLMGVQECGDTPTTPAWEVPGTDYAADGPWGVSSSAGAIEASSGCTLDYTRYVPADGARGPLVVLAHGFQRNQTHMAELAAHLATWGFEVVTPNLCHSVPGNNSPMGDAGDMNDLAEAMGADSVIYMGHSAGGLRSVLAGDLDPQTVAIVGLDAVDVNDIALDAAPGVSVPVQALVGEPSSCNADNNFIPVYQATPDVTALRVTGADHCDFEGPTDALCTSFCQNDAAPFDDGTLRNTIWGLATSAALWQGGVEPAAQGWWEEAGAPYQWLSELGVVSWLLP